MIALGHPPERVWGYTPYQAIAFVRLAEKRLRKERAQDLEIGAMAVRSDAKDINARIRKDWGD